MKILFLGSIWPLAAASAASNRVLQLVEAFLGAGNELVFSADGQENEGADLLRTMGASCIRHLANDSAFDEFVRQFQPDLCVFDRFTTEEKFSWRLRQAHPECLRILDSIDLHCLRLARERALANGQSSVLSFAEILAFAGDTAPREIAAIYRCDLTLIVSDFEIKLLQESFGVPGELLHLCRLYYPEAPAALSFSERRDFAMIGNFRHPPNEDALVFLRNAVWPVLRSLEPEAMLHIWGAHMKPKHLAMKEPKQGFFVHGAAPDISSVFSASKVNLAPLRFGAGIKGKIGDSWWFGTPAVTTAIGAEGMHEDLAFGGIVAESAEDIARAASLLYRNEDKWTEASRAGHQILVRLFSQEATMGRLLTRLRELGARREESRLKNFTGLMLWQQGLRSTEYFSRWIELKGKTSSAPS